MTIMPASRGSSARPKSQLKNPLERGHFKVREEPLSSQKTFQIQLITLNKVHNVAFYNVRNVASMRYQFLEILVGVFSRTKHDLRDKCLGGSEHGLRLVAMR